MGRADLRLVRFGWSPSEATFAQRLCRLVWSEWTHADSESRTAQKAEEGFIRELEVTEGLKLTPPAVSKGAGAPEWAGPSHEHQVTAVEATLESRTKASTQLEKLRTIFEKAGDEENLLWLRFALEDVTDLQTMAAASGREVADFYAAAKRRKRAVQRLLANDRGVNWAGEEP
jgi:hypothetical protein